MQTTFVRADDFCQGTLHVEDSHNLTKDLFLSPKRFKRISEVSVNIGEVLPRYVIFFDLKDVDDRIITCSLVVLDTGAFTTSVNCADCKDF
jgi:hypothetical protein